VHFFAGSFHPSSIWEIEYAQKKRKVNLSINEIWYKKATLFNKDKREVFA